MKEKRIENHSRKSNQGEPSTSGGNINVGSLARLSFGMPENLALPLMGKGKSAPVGRRFCNSQLNGND